MADGIKCVETVYKSESGWGRSYRCKRKPGFGPNAQYCKQHAEKFTEGETATWFRATTWTEYSCEIQRVEVLGKTESTVLIKTPQKARRENKKADMHRYFRTLPEAIAFYRDRLAGLRARADRFEKLI